MQMSMMKVAGNGVVVPLARWKEVELDGWWSKVDRSLLLMMACSDVE